MSIVFLMGLENVAMVKVKKMKIKGGIERSGPSILGAIGEAALSTPLPSPRYWIPKHFTGKINLGSFYEIDHSKLPSMVPHVLRSIRVVLVTAKTEMNVTVRYPSTKSLESYFESGSGEDGALKFSFYPSLDEKFVMGPILAVEVLGRIISSEEFGEHKLARSFWLIDCFSSDKLPSPVSVCDVSIPPEVKKGPLLLDLQSQLKGWGSQRVVAYLPDSPEEMDVRAHSEEMSVHDHPEEMSVHAHPEGMSVPAHPEGMIVHARPEELSVHAHPEGMSAPAHREGMSAPARPEGMSAPAHPEGMSVPDHPEGKSVRAHPDEMSVRDHPEEMSVPDHPEGMSVPDHPEGMSVRDHPEEMSVPDHPEGMSVRDHPEEMSVPDHHEGMIVRDHPEEMSVPDHHEGISVRAYPEGMSVPAHPEGMSEPAHPEGTSEPAHPDGTSVPAHPDGTSVPAHPDGTSVPAQPEGMSVPAHPEGMSEPAHPEGISMRGHPEEISVCGHREEDKRTVKKEEETIVIKDRIIIPYTRKRKRGSPVSEETKKIKHSPKEEPVECKAIITRNKNQGYVQRWPTKRYDAAARQLCEVLEGNRAVYGNPISRCKLRAHARTRIGDTGLLDHFLKHLAGKVIPGGDKRLRRRCDADGKMEYWLESADLAQIRKEAGVQDPYWTPPPGWKLGDCVGPQACLCGEERKKHKEEVSSLKRQIEALKSKNVVEQAIALVRQDSSVSFGRQNSGALMLTGSKRVKYEALLKKRSLMEKQLLEISQALMGVEEDMKLLSYAYQEEPGNKNSPDKERHSEAAEEASDDAEGERADSSLRVRLRVRKLKPCENQDNFSISPSQAVSHKEEGHLVLTADWTPPGSTTTSLTTH